MTLDYTTPQLLMARETKRYERTTRAMKAVWLALNRKEK